MGPNFGYVAAAVLALALAVPVQASPADNKATAINAMTDLFSKQDPTGVERYFGTPYHQHNTRIPDGIDALKNLAQMATKWPGVHTNIVRALADGNLVVLHSAYWNLLDRHQTAVAFDLFRFNKAGKIVEHWDALEGFPGPSPAGQSQYEGTTKISDLDKTASNRRIVRRYINSVVIPGAEKKKVRFLDPNLYIDHGLTDTTLKETARNDPAAQATWSLSDVRYVKLHRMVAEGNFVFTQGEGRLPGNRVIEIYDLFRLEGGKLVEHWDVYQALAPRAKWANSGPF